MISSRDTGVDNRLLCPMSCPFLNYDKDKDTAYCIRYKQILKVGLTTKPNTLDKIRSLFNKNHSPVLKILIYRYKRCERKE